MKVNVLGVKIDDVNMAEALAQIEEWVLSKDKHYIVTPNPEIIVAAQKDNRLKKILNDADLSIPDGIGLKLSGVVKNTVPGIDLMEKAVKLSAEKGFVTGFLGGKEGVAQRCAECLKKKYPGLKVGFVSDGGEVDGQGNILRPIRQLAESGEVLDSKTRSNKNINIPPIDLLFIAFGHIKQEKWIANNLDKIPAHVIMTVGGAFDYLSGSVPRAPKLVRNLGFEWLFRLTAQPWRIKRQLALIKYLWLLLLSF